MDTASTILSLLLPSLPKRPQLRLERNVRLKLRLTPRLFTTDTMVDTTAIPDTDITEDITVILDTDTPIGDKQINKQISKQKSQMNNQILEETWRFVIKNSTKKLPSDIVFKISKEGI